MIVGYIRDGTARNALFTAARGEDSVLRCEAEFYLNEADRAELKLPGTNRAARSLTQKNAVIELEDDGGTVFIGDVALTEQEDGGEIRVDLDGALGWLGTICKAPFQVREGDASSPVLNFLTAIIDQYNAAVSTTRMLQLGAVTVTGNVVMDHHDEYVTMLDLLSEVREQLGGYVYIDYASGIPVLNYIAQPEAADGQDLEFGRNVLTVVNQLDFSSYASRVYVAGTDENDHLITSVATDETAEAAFGRVDVSLRGEGKTTEEIYAEALAELAARKAPLQNLTMTAADLAEIGHSERLFTIGSARRAYCEQIGIDTKMIVRKIKRDYLNRKNSEVSFGRDVSTMSGASGSTRGGSIGGGGVYVLPESVLYTPMTLTAAEKEQARLNIGAAAAGDIPTTAGAVMYSIAQSLTEAQKAQARSNIGVGSGGGSNYYVLAEDIGISILNSGTDNSAALNSFIASNSENRTIRFGCGSYPFADTINMTTTTGLVGNGRETKLVYSGTGTFLNFTVYTAPHIYDLIIKGSGSGIGLKLGLKRNGSDDIVSCRGVLMNVHFYDWTDAINIGGAWGWQIINMNGYNISGWLIHVTGIWNTSTIIGGEYENGANGGVFWDANSNSNAVNFIGIVWESLQSHVFKVGSSAGAVSVNIEGCYFENKKDYNDKTSIARLIDSDKSNSVFNFIGENSIAWNQTIRSVGIVKNPPAASLLALGYYRQPYVVPSARLSAIQKPDYNFHHGEIFDIEGAVLHTDPDRFNGSDVAMKIDDRGLNVAAIASGGGYIHTTFDASQAIQRLYMRLPEGLYDLRNINVGFEFLVPSGTDFSEIVSIYCRIVNVTSNTSQDNGLAVARYISMLGSDVTGTYDRYQVMNCYRNATVGEPSITIGNEHFYNLDMFVSGANVVFTKIFIDDGKGKFASQSLFDETIKTVQADVEEIKDLTAPYVDLDYIESDGASYIDTGIAPNANTKITARFKLASTAIINDAARQYVFGTYSIVDETAESRVQFYYGGSDTDAASREFIGWGSGVNNVGYKYLNIVPDADTHTASLNGAFTLDGTQHFVLSNSVFTAPKSIYLFACNKDGVADYFSDGMRIEAVSIYDDGTLIARFVPKLRRADGAVGMYDEIGETFYENKGFGSFRNESITPQEQDAFPVTLNADGTVNTFDSNLTYSAASASVLNGKPKKLIVTWGNSLFTADADEKLSGVNGDVKFICDVEHDGIQRHVIFTLTSSSILTTTLIETYSRVPVVVYSDSTGLAAIEANMSASPAWQLTGLNLSPFRRIKIWTKAAQKSGSTASASTTPSTCLEMLLDPALAIAEYGNHYLASTVVQKSNDNNRLATLTCAVSSDKTSFAVLRQTNLYGTAATNNNDVGSNVVLIEGYYD